MNNYDTKIIHYDPTLCFDVPFDGTYGTLTRASTRIDDVTCPKCHYYYYHPKARALEIQFRIRNSVNN